MSRLNLSNRHLLDGVSSPTSGRGAGLRALTIAAALLSLAGCGHKIGDACSNSADCDPTGGTRTCDLSQPGGYCIIEGCDARSCPSDSVCGRFFPDQQFLTGMPCDPANPEAACTADEVCLPDGNLANMTGGAVVATCVRAALEKRACVQSCGNNGDCRGGYVCKPFGICGTEALTVDPNATPRYCTPQPATPPTTSDDICPLG